MEKVILEIKSMSNRKKWELYGKVMERERMVDGLRRGTPLQGLGDLRQ
jgi:hypothetical protein